MTAALHKNTRWLIGEIAGALRSDHGQAEGVAEVLQRLAAQDLSPAALRTPEPRRIEACAVLPEATATAMLVSPGTAAAIAACEEDLRWVQNANYSDAAMGAGFMSGYGYCELIGPQGFFAGDDLLLGLMLLGPRRLYRDHYHQAPELYWLLTGPTEWSHDRGNFELRPAGAAIWHPPMLLHATRTIDTPLLAVWCWTRDTGQGAQLA